MSEFPDRPKANPCPFCGRNDEDSPTFYYNGSGPPPSYAVECGWCGARGPCATGNFRDDHEGARVAAIKEWNQAVGFASVKQLLADAKYQLEITSETLETFEPEGMTIGKRVWLDATKKIIARIAAQIAGPKEGEPR